MKISRLLQVLFVSVFVAGPAVASPISLCGGEKAEKAEKADNGVKSEKKAEKAVKKDADKKTASKDSA